MSQSIPDRRGSSPSHASPRRVWAWVLAAAIVVAGLAVLVERPGATQPGPPSVIAWESDFAAASVRSDTSGRPMFVLFTADWCPPCRTLKQEVLARGEVADQLEATTVPVYVDLTDPNAEQSSLARRFGASAIPTMLVMDARGTVIDRMVGAPDARGFLRWLDDAVEASVASGAAGAAAGRS